MKSYFLDAPEGIISVLRDWHKASRFLDGRRMVGHFCSSPILDRQGKSVRTVNLVCEMTEIPLNEDHEDAAATPPFKGLTALFAFGALEDIP